MSVTPVAARLAAYYKDGKLQIPPGFLRYVSRAQAIVRWRRDLVANVETIDRCLETDTVNHRPLTAFDREFYATDREMCVRLIAAIDAGEAK